MCFPIVCCLYLPLYVFVHGSRFPFGGCGGKRDETMEEGVLRSIA